MGKGWAASVPPRGSGKGYKEGAGRTLISCRKEAEPSSYQMPNPSRVVRAQLKTLALPENSPYQPLKALANGGIILLRNSRPDEKEEIVELSAAGGATAEGSSGTNTEPQGHAPFEFVIGNY